jgi:hypothetical protein
VLSLPIARVASRSDINTPAIDGLSKFRY